MDSTKKLYINKTVEGVCLYIDYFFPILRFLSVSYKTKTIQVQSHSFNTLGNRRLSLAALPVVPAASRGVKLPLLADTRSVFQSP